jgi:hypothetical protein
MKIISFVKIFDNLYVKMGKAKITKYKSKKPDGKGGWIYDYGDKKKITKKKKDKDVSEISSNPKKVINELNSFAKKIFDDNPIIEFSYSLDKDNYLNYSVKIGNKYNFKNINPEKTSENFYGFYRYLGKEYDEAPDAEDARALIEMQKSKEMNKAKGFKYYKRVPKKSGKGYNYFYTKEQYDKGKKEEKPEKDKKKVKEKTGFAAAWSSLSDFFGITNDNKLRKKIGEIYSSNEDKLSGLDVSNFAYYANEYLSNKDKWDKKFAGKKSTVGKDKKTGKVIKKVAAKDKTAAPGKAKWDTSLMKKVAGVIGGEGEKESADLGDINKPNELTDDQIFAQVSEASKLPQKKLEKNADLVSQQIKIEKDGKNREDKIKKLEFMRAVYRTAEMHKDDKMSKEEAVSLVEVGAELDRKPEKEGGKTPSEENFETMPIKFTPGKGIKMSIPDGLSNDDKELLKLANSTYGSLLSEGGRDKSFSFGDFAEEIKKTYSMDNPRNKAIHDALIRADKLSDKSSLMSQVDKKWHSDILSRINSLKNENDKNKLKKMLNDWKTLKLSGDVTKWKKLGTDIVSRLKELSSEKIKKENKKLIDEIKNITKEQSDKSPVMSDKPEYLENIYKNMDVRKGSTSSLDESEKQGIFSHIKKKYKIKHKDPYDVIEKLQVLGRSPSKNLNKDEIATDEKVVRDLIMFEKRDENIFDPKIESKSPGDKSAGMSDDASKINQDHIDALSPKDRGRVKKALDKKYNFPDVGTMSLGEYIDGGNISKVEAKEVPKVAFNRAKYNRMDGKQQEEYEKKMKEKKTEYRAFKKDGSFIEIPKMVYESISSGDKSAGMSDEITKLYDKRFEDLKSGEYGMTGRAQLDAWKKEIDKLSSKDFDMSKIDYKNINAATAMHMKAISSAIDGGMSKKGIDALTKMTPTSASGAMILFNQTGEEPGKADDKKPSDKSSGEKKEKKSGNQAKYDEAKVTITQFEDEYEKGEYSKDEWEDWLKEYEGDLKNPDYYDKDNPSDKKAIDEFKKYKKALKDEPKLKEKLMGPKLFKATELLLSSLEKAKKMPIGTVSNGRKKVAEGKWVPVGKDDKPGKSDPKKEDKPGKSDPEKKKPQESSNRDTLKNAAKKIINILAEALSGKDVNQPTGRAIEEAGEGARAKSKQKPKEEKPKPKKDDNK